MLKTNEPQQKIVVLSTYPLSPSQLFQSPGVNPTREILSLRRTKVFFNFATSI
jgi:hypothetical protein